MRLRSPRRFQAGGFNPLTANAMAGAPAGLGAAAAPGLNPAAIQAALLQRQMGGAGLPGAGISGAAPSIPANPMAQQLAARGAVPTPSAMTGAAVTPGTSMPGAFAGAPGGVMPGPGFLGGVAPAGAALPGATMGMARGGPVARRDIYPDEVMQWGDTPPWDYTNSDQDVFPVRPTRKARGGRVSKLVPVNERRGPGMMHQLGPSMPAVNRPDPERRFDSAAVPSHGIRVGVPHFDSAHVDQTKNVARQNAGRKSGASVTRRARGGRVFNSTDSVAENLPTAPERRAGPGVLRRRPRNLPPPVAFDRDQLSPTPAATAGAPFPTPTPPAPTAPAGMRRGGRWKGGAKKKARGGVVRRVPPARPGIAERNRQEGEGRRPAPGMAEGGKWIAGAIRRPGALRKSLGIKAGETIPAKKLSRAARAPGKLGQRARLAITLRSFHKAKGGACVEDKDRDRMRQGGVLVPPSRAAAQARRKEEAGKRQGGVLVPPSRAAAKARRQEEAGKRQGGRVLVPPSRAAAKARRKEEGMAAGGAAKQRRGFPNTIPPPKPAIRRASGGRMRGTGIAERGVHFSGIY
jgi:hypothetical protein